MKQPTVLNLTAAACKRTLVKSSGAQSQWVEEDKDLFEKGLAQFGRRRKKIAKLFGTRPVLQATSYARECLKNKSVSAVTQIQSRCWIST
ncbi:histone H2A deubiquitinase MYSM1-like [Carassius auratus]|uniref:Histone H2A deubiquitinase MYSM1-like n=1 Tax=Carassius auratus TaxID=7957 RepID=A0A6P6R747_CARAU|nr:histone H2A deubiquitinase MYSM1-like [Carassius auratus]